MSQQINLFNPALLPQKKIFATVAMVQALFLIAIGGAALATFISYRTDGSERLVNAGKAELASHEARLVSVGRDFVVRQKSVALDQEVANMEMNVSVLQSAKQMLLRGDFGNTVGYSVYLHDLARQFIAGVWLTRLTISGNDVAIEGSSVRADLVPHYINRLAGGSAFEGKSFGALEIAQVAALVTGSAPAPGSATAPAIYEFKLHAAGLRAPAARPPK